VRPRRPPRGARRRAAPPPLPAAAAAPSGAQPSGLAAAMPPPPAAPPRFAPPPPAAAAAAMPPVNHSGLDFEARFALLGALLHSATQLLHMRGAPPAELPQRLLSIPVAFAPFLWRGLAPAHFDRHRTRIMVLLRATFYCAFPLLRRPTGIQRVLKAPPTSGAGGAALDLVKAAWGTRLVAILMTGLIMPLPVLPHAALQLLAVALVRSNPTACASHLLAAPLSRRRQRAWASAACTLLLQPFGGAADAALAAAEGADCDALLTALHLLVGVTLPLALLAHVNSGLLGGRPAGRGDAERAPRAAGSGTFPLFLAWVVVTVCWALAVSTTL
jgi:hypothetical protein